MDSSSTKPRARCLQNEKKEKEIIINYLQVTPPQELEYTTF